MQSLAEVEFLRRLLELFWLELFFPDNWKVAIVVAFACYSVPLANRRITFFSGIVASWLVSIVVAFVASHVHYSPQLPIAVGIFLLAALIKFKFDKSPRSFFVEGRVSRALTLLVVFVTTIRLFDNNLMVRLAMARGDPLIPLTVSTAYVAAIAMLFLALRLRFSLTTKWMGVSLLAAIAGNTLASSPISYRWFAALQLPFEVSKPAFELAIALVAAAFIIAWHARLSAYFDGGVPANEDARSPRDAAAGLGEVPAAKWAYFAKDILLSLGILLLLLPRDALEEWTSWLRHAAMVVLLLCLFAYLVALRMAQTQRNALLRSIYRDGALDLPDRVSVFLYLRSFDVARSSLLGRAIYHALVSSQFWLRPFFGTRYDVEEELADAVAKTGLLLAIGDRRISFGAAKLSTGIGWRNDFEILAARSSLIFLAPARTDNVKWEILSILKDDNLRQKTFWVMPSHLSKKRWEDIQEYCLAEFGLTLSQYLEGGCFFRIDPFGKAESVPLEVLVHQLGAATAVMAGSSPCAPIAELLWTRATTQAGRPNS